MNMIMKRSGQTVVILCALLCFSLGQGNAERPSRENRQVLDMARIWPPNAPTYMNIEVQTNSPTSAPSFRPAPVQTSAPSLRPVLTPAPTRQTASPTGQPTLLVVPTSAPTVTKPASPPSIKPVSSPTPAPVETSAPSSNVQVAPTPTPNVADTPTFAPSFTSLGTGIAGSTAALGAGPATAIGVGGAVVLGLAILFGHRKNSNRNSDSANAHKALETDSSKEPNDEESSCQVSDTNA